MSSGATRPPRERIAGPSTPAVPFPLRASGAVQRGFGRGSKELGCPTANLPQEALEIFDALEKEKATGVYYGFAQVDLPDAPEGEDKDRGVFPMAMSVGWNPYYKNEKLTAEVHIIHEYANDFYGRNLRVVVLGYIRPELDYISKEALIEDIDTDKRVAIESLARPAYAVFKDDALFTHPTPTPSSA